jgi:uncharacterized protein involved in exopolysaccharide biosynthesis
LESTLLVHEEPPIPLRRLLDAVFRARLWLFAAALVGALIGFAIGVYIPDEYVSSGTFLLRTGSEDLVVNPLLRDDPTIDPRVNGSLVDNAPYVLQTNELAERVVDRLGAEYILTPFRAASLDPGTVAWPRSTIHKLQRWIHARDGVAPLRRTALQMFRANLSVVPLRRSEIIRVSYRSHDPQAALRIISTYIEEAQRRHLEVYGDALGIEFAEQEHQRCLAALAAAETEYGTLGAAHLADDLQAELAAARESMTQEHARIESLTRKIDANQLAVAPWRERCATIPKVLSSVEIVSQVNPRVAALETMLQARETDLIELRAVLREDDAAVVRAKNHLADLRQKIQAEPTSLRIEQSRQRENPEHTDAARRVLELEIELAVDREMLNRAQAALAATNKRVSALRTQVDRERELAQLVQSAKAALTDAKRALTFAERKKALNQRNISSLTVVDRPSLPTIKEGPQRAKLMLLGTLAGIVGGIGAIILRSVIDRTIRSRSDLAAVANAPVVLATLPWLDRQSIRRHQDAQQAGR